MLTEPPDPPYYAVIFSSLRTDRDNGAYAEAAARMLALAAEQPGFLGVDSARGADRSGITVSYWRDEESIKAWREHAAHLPIQRTGRGHWYEWYAVHVARVERSYHFSGAE
jgi:heme-degrading monooxygenase HmoA